MHTHESHSSIINRLKRAKGHLASVIDMIERGEKCVDTARQLQAVNKAVYNAKQVYIKDHIENCLDVSSLTDQEKLSEVIAEFKEITKYLE